MKNSPPELRFSPPFILYYLPGLLISVTASISLYAGHLETVIYTPPNSLWRTEIAFVVLFLVLSAVLYAATKDHSASGMVGTIFMSGLVLAIDVFIEFALCIVVAWIAIALLTRRMNFKQVEVAIILASVILFGYYGVAYAGHLVNGAKWDENASMAAPIWSDYQSRNAEGTPDIYYIILDGYGGESMLREIHNIDNSQFIRDLESRGFIIPPDSKANYPRTILSLASSLNLQYLDSVSENMQDSPLWWPLTGTIMNNETVKYLRANGYSIANTASNWDYTTLPDADYVFNPFSIYLNKFEEYQVQQTNLSFLNSMDNNAVSLPTYPNHRKTVLFALDSLGEMAQLPSPKFALVHIVSPHPPFIFDADGNEITPNYPFTLSDSKNLLYPPSNYRQGYADQMQFINRKVLAAVDAILANSETPPIIIIQGDHGPGVFIEYGSVEETCLYERFSILNAYYLPGMDDVEISPDISPVNTFRIIFNFYFSEDLEILPDRQYFSKKGMTYQFTDISEKVQPFCDMPQE
jgi:hypothetical protein